MRGNVLGELGQVLFPPVPVHLWAFVSSGGNKADVILLGRVSGAPGQRLDPRA